MYKLIGTFSEVDGIETETMTEMINRLNLIGSLSDDVGSVKIYYADVDPVVYVIAENSEIYYGKKEDFIKEKKDNKQLLEYALKKLNTNKTQLEIDLKNEEENK